MVDEYTLKLATYRHMKSGAEVISVQADDDNKVFGISFRTPVSDSTGVPHVLEHSVLCGSEKYTSKEPFTQLLKGSLNTFLNAFTYPDRTCYPVASQNLKDFYNLTNVYLDAVLNPRAKRDPAVLQQEGWHYELENKDAPMVYKGVVFNEMKGVYSSPQSLLYRAAQQVTFPDNSYRNDSGGDPTKIPDLSFQQFRQFHDAFYHPANSRVFFYGDDDPSGRLDLLDAYFSKFDRPLVPPLSEIATQPLLPEPRRVVERFPASEAEAAPDASSHMLMITWLLHQEPLSKFDELALAILDQLLMGTRTSVLYKALLDSQLGAAVVGGGLQDALKQTTFSVGLQDVKAENVPKVEQLITAVLAKAAVEGFDTDAIEAALNTFEFRLREMNTGGFPKGLVFMLSLLPRWIYREDGANVADALRFEESLAELKAKLASGEDVFQSLLRRFIVDNRHRSTIELQPDAELAAKQQAQEEQRLASAKASMSEAEVETVIRATIDLKEAQLKEDSPEDLATIPRVGLQDLEQKIRDIPTMEAILPGGGVLLTHPLPCAGVVYAEVLFELKGLPLEEVPLVPLFTRLLLETGTSELDAVALQRRIGARTGGITVATMVDQPVGEGGVVADPMSIEHRLVVKGKATRERVPDMFELVHSILADAQLDSQSKVVELLRESKSRLEASFISSGHTYAGLRLASRNTLVGYVSEATQGLTYYETVQHLLEQAQNDWPSLLRRLEALRATILTNKDLVINITADPDALEASRPVLDGFVSKLPEGPGAGAHAPPAMWMPELNQRVDEAFAVTTQVNYVASGCQLFQPSEKCTGAFAVVTRALSLGYLWDSVRVVGGAYGGGCTLNSRSGGFAFSSYRDPNLQGTLDVYQKTCEALELMELSDSALEQAIVGAVGDMDKPLTPDQKGRRALDWYLTKSTSETRQEFRDQMLNTTRDDFRAFAERLRGVTLNHAVVASEEAITKANETRGEGQHLSLKRLS